VIADAPNPYSWHDVNTFFRNMFSFKVVKVLINTGRICPHKVDGSGGCTFCSETSILPANIKESPPLEEQIERGIQALARKYRPGGYIVYFQRGTNTAVPASSLHDQVTKAMNHDQCVGVALGTRPDCLPVEIVRILKELASQKPLFLELGLQSAHNKTLEKIRRGHSVECFTDVVETLAGIPNLFIIAHMILGLPGETRQMMLESFRFISHLPLSGVKIHHLQIVRGTSLEEEYQKGKISVFNEREYVPLLADVLELLPWRMAIHRLVGDQPRDHLVAPVWTRPKDRFILALQKEFEKRGTRQGAEYLSA